MSDIVLNDEQAKLLIEAARTVVVRDSQGRLIGMLTPCSDFTPEEIEEAKQDLASKQPRYTTEQVLDHLRSLERR